MKHIIAIVVITFFCCLSISADTVIQMEPYGGVYRIPCMVNGAKMKFIFDTGASDVCLSMTMAEYLYDNGYIDDEDIIGTGSSKVADGRIVDHIRLKLKDIQINDFHIYNVEAVVIDGQNAPLLMGQSAIQKLGSIEINGNLLTIRNGEGKSDDDYISDLREKIIQSLGSHRYEKALELYDILYNLGEITDDELCDYAEILYLNHTPEKAIKILNEIDDINAFNDGYFDPYRTYAVSYFDLENFDKARHYMKLSNKYHEKSLIELAEGLDFIGDCYYYQRLDRDAGEAYAEALSTYGSFFGVDGMYLLKDCLNELKKNQKSYRDKDIEKLVFKIALTIPDVKTSLSTLQRLARAGNRDAIEYLNKAGIFDF